MVSIQNNPEKMKKKLLSLALPLCMLMAGSAQAQTRQIPLNDNWTVGERGNTYSCSLPTTAMGVLTANGECNDVMTQLNYRKIDTSRFDHPWTFSRKVILGKLGRGRRVVLHLAGVDYRADVRWNGHLVASKDTLEGPLRHFDIDVTQWAKADNELSLTVWRAQDGEPNHGFCDWNVRPADENMGLVRPMSLSVIDQVAISHPAMRSKVNTQTLNEAELTFTTLLTNVTNKTLKGTLTGRFEGGVFAVPVTLLPHERRHLTLTPDQASVLRVRHPRLWWCAGMGKPELYHLQLDFEAEGRTLATDRLTFGIRQIDASIDTNGHRLFRLNGRPVVIRGGGWVDDLFLRHDSADYINQLTLTRDMGLNTVRLEGFWGTTGQFYDSCDSLGLMVMVGLSCHWEWDAYLRSGVENDYSSIPNTPKMRRLVSLSLRDQVMALRQHPSIICWMIGSDHTPYPEWEQEYYNLVRPIDDRVLQLSAADHTSNLSGPSGMKMSGPYEFEGPSYYYMDKSVGRADGFNSETSIGAQLPVRENVERIVGREHAWPVRGNDYYNYHCTASATAMNTLDQLCEAMDRRFGPSNSLAVFLQRANLMQLEGAQGMFEAFRSNEPRSTGVIHWMLNSAWPSFFWQLYDWFDVPTSAYYGAKRANRPVQLTYDYASRKVYAVNDTLAAVGGTADIQVLNLSSESIHSFSVPLTVEPNQPQVVDDLGQMDSDCVVFLSFTNGRGESCSSEYFVAAQSDDYDWKRANWYMTPIKDYASYEALNALPPAPLTAKATRAGGRLTLQLRNDNDCMAFFTELVVVDAQGLPVPYATLSDNYVTLRPHSQLTLTIHCAPDTYPAAVRLRTWNTPQQEVRIGD